jgi:hypothetical protein
MATFNVTSTSNSWTKLEKYPHSATISYRAFQKLKANSTGDYGSASGGLVHPELGFWQPASPISPRTYGHDVPIVYSYGPEQALPWLCALEMGIV